MIEDKDLENFYVTKDVDVEQIKEEYDQDVSDMSPYISQCRDAYEQRNCEWSGKNYNLTKESPDAFPWQGASDLEVFLIEEFISTYVAMLMNAVERSNIRAYPTEAGDLRRAKITSSFLKWMRDNYIKDFKRHMELDANNFFEKAMAVSHVDWEKKTRKIKRKIDLEQLIQLNPGIEQLLESLEADDELVEIFQNAFEGISKTKAKKVLNDLRKEGVAEVYSVVQDINRPFVQSKFPDSDFIMPSYTMDVQRAPRVHMRYLMTPQEIENRVQNEDWDADVGEVLIKNHRGVSGSAFDLPNYSQSRYAGGRSVTNSGQVDRSGDDLIEVIFTYRRLIDKDDGSEGIYLTVWNSQYTKGYLRNELLDGYEQYPFVVTPLQQSNKRVYDMRTFPDLLRGPQKQAKVIRDGWTDQQSITISPPLLHPTGRAPQHFGPHARIGVRPQDRFEYMDIPNTVRESTEVESFVRGEALDLVGLRNDNPLAQTRQQYYINRFLQHVANVLKMAYQAYQAFGPDELYFRVTGHPDPIQFKKNPVEEELDVTITFDTLMNDPEMIEQRVNLFRVLAQNSQTGRFNMEALDEIMANMIDPTIADAVMVPIEQGIEQIQRDVAEDLAMIFSGQPVNARPAGAQIALQYIANYVQGQSVQARLVADEEFRNNLQNYTAQYEQQLAQVQNAETGRLGAPSAEMGNINMAEINQ